MLKSSLSAEQKRELYMKAYNDNKKSVDDRVAEGIEKYRKGFCRIRFTDESGRPLGNQRVKVTQKSHEFKYGANIFMLDEFENEADNIEYRRFFKEYFNLATVPFYWNTLEPEENKPRYAVDSPKIYRRPAPDLCLDYCEESGIEAKLHCLVYEYYVPEWLKTLPLSEVKAKYEERFRQISERYSGRMFEIEVINELLCHYRRTELSHNKDIIPWSFKTARKYFPNETLVINESNPLQAAAHQDYCNAYYMLIENALLKGASIDKIGLQNHIFTGSSAKTNEQYDASIKSTVNMSDPMAYFKALDLFAEFGLPLELTEVTVSTFGDTPEDEELQADILKLLYSVWFSHPAVDAIVYWNTVDGYAHKGNENWIENNCRGGLFHHDLTPKKSALMLKKLFGEKWRTEVELITDNDGYIDFRGFYGDYELSILQGKETVEKQFSLHKSENNKYTIKI